MHYMPVITADFGVNAEGEEADGIVTNMDMTSTKYTTKVGSGKTGSVISNERYKPGILFTIAQTTAALARLNTLFLGKVGA